MTKEEIISNIYRKRNYAYEKFEELNHPDFMYDDNKRIYKEQFRIYDEILGMLMTMK